jgi:hypothetical protein
MADTAPANGGSIDSLKGSKVSLALRPLSSSVEFLANQNVKCFTPQRGLRPVRHHDN